MNRVDPWLDRLTRALAMAALAALLLVAALSLFDAAMRWSGGPRVPGLHDLMEFIFAMVVASCFPIGLMRRSTITVRLLGRWRGPRVAHWADLFGDIVTLIVFLGATAGVIALASEFGRAGRTTSTLDLPLAPWMWGTATALGLACLVQMVMIARRVLTGATGEVDP